MGSMGTPDRRVRILAVCTGNVCRSPYAQLRLGQALDEAAPGVFEVTSAGTGALVGNGIDPGTGPHLGRHGIDGSAFRARQVRLPILEAADLVLVMTREHLDWVVDESPRIARRAFTLKEFARLVRMIDELTPWRQALADAGDDDVERWQRMVAIAAARRRALRLRRPESDDTVDPYRRGERAFAVMADEVDAAVATIADTERRLRAPLLVEH